MLKYVHFQNLLNLNLLCCDFRESFFIANLLGKINIKKKVELFFYLFHFIVILFFFVRFIRKNFLMSKYFIF